MSEGLPKVGELVAGRYRILQELGRGGYGVVYRARQDVMGRDVAIKILNPEAAQKESEVERFRREVFHASGLRHPNTIQLFDFGETNGLFFIVMEYLEGVNLRDHVMMHGALTHDQALEVTLQILKSLREAHEHGIVHRDLKPENIFLLDTGSEDEIFVKVLDFGLSKYVEGSPSKEPTLTKEGVIFGTPQYMSPEQAYGKKVRPETDIYALGLLVFEMVTARSAFTGRSSMEILIKQVSQPLPNLPDKLQGTVVADFVEVCTQKEQEDRFSNAGSAYTWLVRKRSEISMVSMLNTIPKAPEELAPPTPVETLAEQSHAEPISLSYPPVEEFDIEMRLAQLPLMGRERELDELMHWSRQSLYTGGVAWVTGGIGVGKTRVVDEWIRHLELEGVHVLLGSHHEDGGTLEGLREALTPVIERPSNESATIPDQLSFDRIKELRGILNADSDRESELGQDWAFASIEQSLYALARIRPTVLVLEDLQYADSFTLRLLDHWQEELAGRSIPLVLVLTSRTDEMGNSEKLNQLSNLTGRYVGMSFAYALHLNRLTEDDSRKLLRYLMPLRDDVVEYIAGLAKGNPLFLTQVIRYLAEENFLAYDEGHGHWAPAEGIDLRGRLVPPTLQDLLLRRVKTLVSNHKLGSVLKALLCRAMILGNRFELRLLKDLLHREGRQDLESYMDDALQRLGRSGVLNATVMGNQAAMEFAYNITRRALLDSEISVGENLAEIHRIAAEVKHEFYKNAARERRGELASSIAEHFQSAGNRKEALSWLMTAAEHAEEAQDFRAALDCYNDAESTLTESLDPDGERLLQIRLAQGRLHTFLGEFGHAEYALERAREEAQRVGDTVGQALTGESLAGVLQLLARYDEATDYYQSTIQLFTSYQDTAGVLRCRVGLGEVERYKGHYLRATEVFSSCLKDALKEELPEIEVRCLYGLGQCYYAAGKLNDARDAFQKTRKRAELGKNWRLVSQVDIELALMAFLTESTARSEALATAALEAKRNLGDSLGQSFAHLTLGMCLRRCSRIGEAEYHVRRARTISERLAHKYGVAKAILLEGEIAWMKGDLDEALKFGMEALQLHIELADSHGEALSLIYLGLFEIERGKPEDARKYLTAALDLGGKEALGLYQANCLLFLGMCYESEGEFEEAVALYGEALQLSEGFGNREIASLAAISLAKLHLVMGDIEAAKTEIPIARNQAELLGNNIALMFAVAGEAWLARLLNNPHVLQNSLQKLRLLSDNRSGMNLRVPERLTHLGAKTVDRLSPKISSPIVLAVAEVIESLGSEDLANGLRKKLSAKEA